MLMNTNLVLVVILSLQSLLLFALIFFYRSRQGRDGEAVLSILRQELTSGFERIERELRDEMASNRKEAAEQSGRERREYILVQTTLHKRLSQSVRELGTAQVERLEGFSNELTRVAKSLDERFEQLRIAVERRLQAIQDDNGAKLEEMRRTVDEKLHATLQQRLGESFKQVSERLEQVHRGLGEMQNLAVGVGDLKRVLTNVKTRGSWGEMQLGNLLEQLLTAEQYGCNVTTHPGSNDRVEFAIRLPGKAADAPVWLPVDAKFPMEDYQRLMEAQDRGEPLLMEEAAKAIETRLKAEARNIREKYIAPPHTTDFAILYLPIEGLYAEALRHPGLADTLQREWRVNLAGPTTLAALLNSLQMGFRTLAIEQRSAEVWTVLGAVKTEFGKFGEALAHTKKKLDEASNSIGKAEVRTRALSRKLKNVEALPVPDAERLLDDVDNSVDATGKEV